MSEQTIPIETRQAMFCAVVVANAAGEAVADVGRVGCAMLLTPSAELRCAHFGLSSRQIVDSVDRTFTSILARIEADLGEAGERFGSAAHIASLNHGSWPLSPEVQAVLQAVAGREEPMLLTPLNVLLALVSADRVLAERLRNAGVTSDMLQRA